MKKVWGLFWTIMSIMGGYMLWCTWNLPSESKNAILLGMSKNKLALFSGLALLTFCCLFGAISSFLKKDNVFSNGKIAGILTFFITFAIALGVVFLRPPVGKTAFERSLAERLTPAFYWGLAFAALAAILLVIQKFNFIRQYVSSSISALVWGVCIGLLMFGGILYALISGTGLEPISRTFYRQGVSILEGHLILPLLFLYPILPLFPILSPKLSGKRAGTVLTVISFVLIWAAAVYFWQTASFQGRSYFAPALRPPNNNFYPASDAENYDLLAQSVLLGNGFRNGLTVVRPLYAAFLALLHFIFGNDYMRLTNGQIIILAFIPAIAFLIGKNIKNTAAGILISVWVIWREIYSIRITHLVQVSNSRLLMSDLPTMLMLMIIILCSIKWYRFEMEETRSLLYGGAIGAAMLLRTQCFVLIPLLWLIFFCSSKKISKKWLSVLFSFIGILIVFLPWTLWGKIHPNTTVNTDVSEGNYLTSLYRSAAGAENSGEGLLEIILHHPQKITEAAAAHFLNNEISSLLILPIRIIKPEESDQLLYEENLFWYRENARETIENNYLLITIYLLLIVFGIISAYRKNRFGGLIPFLFHVVYNLGCAFALTSGFRFILPSDWVLLFYFAFGVCELLRLFHCVCLFYFKPQNVFSEEGSSNTRNFQPQNSDEIGIPSNTVQSPDTSKIGQGWAFSCSIILLAIIGSILPLCEKIIPRKFVPKTSAQIESEWRNLPEPSTIDISTYKGEKIIFLEGRAFYPRFYKAGEGDSGGSSSAKRGLDFDRMVWMFHDQKVHVLCAPLTADQTDKMVMQTIPDPLDVIVVGIQRDDYIEVLEMRRLDGMS